MGRLTLIALVVFAALTCAACGGAKQTTASRALPSALVKRIQAQVRKPSVLGTPSGNAVAVYGPANHTAIEKAVNGKSFGGDSAHGRGPWYLLVLRGKFAGNIPLPPGAKEPHPSVVMEIWSPRTNWGADLNFTDHLPAAVSRLHGHTVVELS